jgi:uncharacterized protein (TIGR03437 family)
MQPPMADGGAPCEAISKPIADFDVSVFGMAGTPVYWAPGEIQYIGSAPCQVAGTVQINFRLPTGVTPNLDGTVTVSVRPGVNSGTIAVR